ncbi:MAG: sigma-54 dependent transcriptional regulator [Smithellaceae bacterium]|nr:sigma-54 dependent transcriptional regulator [Smithellaceae bacterium]
MPERLLIVEDEDTLCQSLKRVFLKEGYAVDVAGNAESALKGLKEKLYDLIITDIILPGLSGIELLKKYKEYNPDQMVIIMTANASLETAIESLRAGAYHYVMKPIIHEEIKRIVRNALRERSLKTENILLKRQLEERYNFERIVGNSPAILSLINEVKKIANAKSSVLLLGETGTGKELFARAIHANSERTDKPFIPINCSAIPENLLEAELFGFAKGAFTGAVSAKRGLFEVADGGTFFLDEIGDLSQPLQAKLLRFLDDQEIRPLGGVQTRKVDVRLITATNRDIDRAVKEGIFREDLYYRINVVTIRIPSLRERKDDIDVIAKHYLDKYSNEMGKPVKFIDNKALQLLTHYHWPGNVRELKNVIERAVLITDSPIILADHLPEGISAASSFSSESLEAALSIEDYTKKFILRHQSGYNEQKIADMLGITRKALWEKRKRWGIKKN